MGMAEPELPESPEMVELHPASFWDCPSCGSENFIRHIVDDKDEPPEPGRPTVFDSDSNGEEITYSIPIGVKCKHCNNIYMNKDYADLIERDGSSDDDTGDDT